MTFDLFAETSTYERVRLGPAAFVLRGFALARADALLEAVAEVAAQAPFRTIVTPGGHPMSVTTTCCGEWGWTSDPHGYRYTAADPASGQPWPAMPSAFAALADEAAAAAGFAGFRADACLINRYLPGARMSLHQDRDERDRSAPIVSVSLGMSALFLFGGFARRDPAMRVPLLHGDIAVWGGEDRMRFHGVLPVKDKPHPRVGGQRINLTFRKAG